MRPRARRAVTGWLAAGVLGAGCTGAPSRVGGRTTARPPVTPAAPADTAWPAVRDAARTALAARAFARAEAVLDTFAARYPQTRAAAEARYWWALVRLHPGNRAADLAPALAVLDAYRIGDPGAPHAVEAALLRALVAQQDSLRLALSLERAAAAAAAGAAQTARAGFVPRDSLRARDEELARVRAEAAEAQAELDRVRRRIAAPDGRGGRARP